MYKMKINTNPDCGNSPKKQFIQNLTIFFASYEVEKVAQYFAEDIVWQLVGDKPIKGKENFSSELKRMSHIKTSELSIYNIITHGKEAAINGEMKMENGSIFGFSDFYEFSSASAKKIKFITSYVVQIK